jgi:hypothetical protein
MVTEDLRTNGQEQDFLSDYPPSWFDRLTARINQFPGPNWVYYFGFVITLVLIGGLLQRLEDPLGPIELQPVAIITFIQIAYVLTLLDFLDKRAEISLAEFRPVLRADEDQYQAMRTRLTVLPSKPVLVMSLITALFMFGAGLTMMNLPSLPELDPRFSVVSNMFSTSPFGLYALGVFIFLWVLNVIFIYRTFRTLRTIDYIYIHHTEINLFQQTELHAFSKMSASIAIGFVLTSPMWIIIDPGLITMGINISFAFLAIFMFVSPLIGVRRLLKAQKDQLINESAQKKEILIQDLFSRIDRSDLSQVENLENALSSLEMAESQIKKISTWPWQTDTLRQMIGALLLPITIWIIQFFLNQLLSNR